MAMPYGLKRELFDVTSVKGSVTVRPLTPADRDRIGHFIQHYERITRNMMDGGRRADVEVQLDTRRNVTEVKRIGA